MLRFLCSYRHRSASHVAWIVALALVIGGCGAFIRVPEAERYQKTPPAKTLPNLTGVWSSEAGNLQLTQTDSRVVGFLSDGGMRIEGTVKHDRLTAMWFDKDAQKLGRVRLEISAGGDTLMGTRSELEGKWETKVSPWILVRK